MAFKKEIDVVVNVDNTGVKQLANSLNEVEGEAKKASKSIDDVAGNGGAIAVLDQLTGGLATKLKDSYEASKLFNVSLKGTRAALIATGIGAFVVALGLVVAYWDDIKGFITGSNDELERQNTLLDKNAKGQEQILSLLDSSDNILKLQGKSQEEINRLKEEEIQKLIEIQVEQLKLQKQRLAELTELRESGGKGLESFFRIGTTLLTFFAEKVDALFKKLGITTELAEGVAQSGNTIIDNIFGTKEDITELEESIKSLESSLTASQNRLAGFELERRKALEGTGDTAQVGLVNGLTPNGIIELDAAKALNENLLEEQKRYQKALTDEIQKEEARRVLFAEISENAKQEFAQNTLRNLGSLFKEGSKLAKGFAIADVVRGQISSVSKTISNTVEANAKAVALSPLTGGQPFVTFNTVNAALGIASSIAGAAKAIQQINGDAKSVGGGGDVGGGASASAPSFNLVEGTEGSQITNAIREQRQPLKAYVVSGEVTTGQELDRRAVEKSTL